MPRASRLRRPCAGAALLLAVACTLFDPLDQEGLGVILSPADTALLVGARLPLHGLMFNSYGDLYPSEHLRYSVLGTTVSIDGNGTITGLVEGRAQVVVTRESLADTGWVSVVPAGTIAMTTIAENPVLQVMDADGSGLATLTDVGGFGGGPADWLPGNGGLVYQWGTHSTRIHVTDLAGATHVLAPVGRSPRVSLDGAWVYFWRDSNYVGGIWRVHPDGSGEEVVIPPTPYVGGVDADPSPDGTQLAFRRRRWPDDGRFDLMVRDLATGAERILAIDGFLPRWSPDGTRIAYWRGSPSADSGAIHVMLPDGSADRQASMPGRVYKNAGLDWSPNGVWLVARSAETVDLIEEASGLTLPLGYTAARRWPAWR